MLVRNPYGTNLDVIVNDEYLEFKEFFSEDGGRAFPPFFPPNNKPGPPNFNNGPIPPKPPMPGPPSNPNNVPGPPPSYTPKQAPSSKSSNSNMLKVSPGSLSPCKYQYVYVWQTNGSSYWAWFTRIDRTTASGYRWNGYRWVYFGVDLNRIESFECYGRNPSRSIDNVVSNLQTQTLAPSMLQLEYPFISNMETEDIENTINAEIIDTLDDLLQNQVLVPEKVNFQKVLSAYEVPLDGYGLLSIVMSLSTLVEGEKTPRITFDSLTVDLNTGEKYDFEDLFNSKSNYKEEISRIAMDVSKKLNAKLVVPYQGITDSQKYYLTPEELVLYYQVDEYTPASQGLFRLPIPYKVITNYLSPKGPINKILNPSNVITEPPSTEVTPLPTPAEEGGTAMGPEYLGTYTGVVPEEEGGSAMSPEYMGTYTGVVPEDESYPPKGQQPVKNSSPKKPTK